MHAETVHFPRRRRPDAMAIETWRAPDGWQLRSFSLPAEGRPKGAILFLGGRGDFFEKYLEPFQVWRQAGWSVAGFDWRGQGGSGALHAAGGCHIDDFATFVADLAAFCADWQARTAGPHVVVGHSMGGHVLLRAAAAGVVSSDGMVLLAPMLGIRAGPIRGRTMHSLAALGRTRALRRRPIWTALRSGMQGRITSCAERQADKVWWKSVRPDLARGGPTWGWLTAATRSIAALERELAARPLTVPGLILAAADDAAVDVAAIRRTARLLPSFELTQIDDAGHELLRERDVPRLECLERIGRFLDGVAARAERAANLSTE